MIRKILLIIVGVGLITAGCGERNTVEFSRPQGSFPTPTVTSQPTSTPLPTRPVYAAGELVSYTAQNGDTLPGLAGHFNTTVEEILEANPIIPKSATTLPPGLPMEIPIYFRSFWGSPFQIVPDSHFINGPLVIDFDTSAFIAQSPGWLKDYSEYASDKNRTAADVINLVAQNFSISPRILIALVEYQAKGISEPEAPSYLGDYPLGYKSIYHRGLYLQLVWAANKLNNGYYGWRTGDLFQFDLTDLTTERPDPWQNAATVGLQYFFSSLLSPISYQNAIGADGYSKTYQDLFGDPWEDDEPHIPGSLKQPAFILPFEAGKTWSFTGGPHTGWGEGAPFAAIDFAPSSDVSGCFFSQDFAVAIEEGVVSRTGEGLLVIDLDMDGDERTGWSLFYLHVSALNRPVVGTFVKPGDPLGHPSCEGGASTGSHIHLARKYNGEWIPVNSALPFVLEGWTVYAGREEYQGYLTRFEERVEACDCGSAETLISATGHEDGSP